MVQKHVGIVGPTKMLPHFCTGNFQLTASLQYSEVILGAGPTVSGLELSGQSSKTISRQNVRFPWPQRSLCATIKSAA